MESSCKTHTSAVHGPRWDDLWDNVTRLPRVHSYSVVHLAVSSVGPSAFQNYISKSKFTAILVGAKPHIVYIGHNAHADPGPYENFPCGPGSTRELSLQSRVLLELF